MQERVMITCAVTGSSPLPNHPNFPKSAQEIAESGLKAAEAGASLLHIHVREPETGAPSTEFSYYKEVVDRIRAKNNEVIINLTTGPGCNFQPDEDNPGMPGPGTNMMHVEDRLYHVLELKPEVCTLDICTMQIFGGVAINTDKTITRMGHMIRDAGVKPEIECFEAGDFVFAQDLIAKGALDGPGMYSFVLGVKYGLPATTEAMMYSKNQMPPGAVWTGFGVSRHSFPMAAQSVILGGHVRTGFEDTIWLSKGKLAPDNADLVNQAVEIVERLGTKVATPGESRKMLGLLH
jgi:uncharacterized protein (DUF849 family)